MESIFNIALYAVVGIIVVFVFLKFGKTRKDFPGNPGYKGPKPENQMPGLAGFLGLNYQDIAPPSDNKTLYNTGDRIYGTYRGIDMEIVYTNFTRESNYVPIGYTYAYDYSINKYFAFKVCNPHNKAFSINTISPGLVIAPTGNELFDKSLAITGDIIIPDDFIRYFGNLGWMKLSLKKDVLIFNDSFYEDLSNTKGGMAMISAVHPVWKTSSKNTVIDYNNIKIFIDKLVDLIEITGIN